MKCFTKSVKECKPKNAGIDNNMHSRFHTIT